MNRSLPSLHGSGQSAGFGQIIKNLYVQGCKNVYKETRKVKPIGINPATLQSRPVWFHTHHNDFL